MKFLVFFNGHKDMLVSTVNHNMKQASILRIEKVDYKNTLIALTFFYAYYFFTALSFTSITNFGQLHCHINSIFLMFTKHHINFTYYLYVHFTTTVLVYANTNYGFVLAFLKHCVIIHS